MKKIISSLILIIAISVSGCQKEQESAHAKMNRILKIGKENGIETELYENGQKLREINYKNWLRNGLMIEWDKSGQKIKEVNFKNGKRDGLMIEWYKSGLKKMETNFKDDKCIDDSSYCSNLAIEEEFQKRKIVEAIVNEQKE
jgi:antitoxin component YwqK of YwqJK toxin-antitoxin module